MAMDVLGLAKENFFNFVEEAEKLASQQMLVNELEDFVRELFEIEEGKDFDDLRKQKRDAANVVMSLAANGVGNAEFENTRWAAYNAVTEYIDHERTTKKDRLEYSWFGGGRDLRETAWSLLNR